MEMKKQVQQLALFDGIAASTMEQILSIGKVFQCPKGTFLMRMKEPVTAVYVQLTGKSIIYNLSVNGKRKILFLLGKGVLLNEHILNQHTSTVYCETIEESKVLVIPVTEFARLMEEDFGLTKNIIKVQERKIWRLGHQLRNTTSDISLERRLISKLWKLSKDFGLDTEEGREIDVNLSITFLADLLGTQRETVSRICSSLVENGLIRINKKRFVILNQEKMTALYKSDQKQLIKKKE